MKIGFTELIVVCVVALLVLGPDKLPVYAKKLGEALRSLKSITGDLANEINESVVEPLNEVAQPLKDAADEITRPMNEVKNSIESIGKPVRSKAADEKKAEAAAALQPDSNWGETGHGQPDEEAQTEEIKRASDETDKGDE